MSGQADERVAERGELSDDLGLEASIALAPVGKRRRPRRRPPLAPTAIDDHRDVGLRREFAGQIGEEIGLLAGDDEEMLGHAMSM